MAPRGHHREVLVCEVNACYARVGVLALLALLGAASCSRYKGDGNLIRRGPTAAIDRYVLDLGPVDLTKEGERSYSMAGLPNVRMTVGVEITAVRYERLSETRPLTALVEVLVVNRKKEVVIHQRGELSQWSWESQLGESTAFIYRGGEAREISRSAGGATRYELVGVRADHGWGTFFQPSPREKYVLTFSILKAGSILEGYGAKLKVKGGGWKS